MNISFRAKTILSIALIEAVVLSALIWTGLRHMQAAAEQEFLQRAATTARLFAVAATDGVLATDIATLDSLTQEMMGRPGTVYARVLDRTGRVLAQRGAPELLVRTFVPDTEVGAVDDGVFDTFAVILEVDTDFGRVEIGSSVAELEQASALFTRRLAGIAVFGMMLAALFSFALGTYLTRQIVALREGARRLADDGAADRLPVYGRDEFAATAEAFNTMTDRLSETLTGLRRSEEKFRGIFENALEGIYQVTLDGRMLSANPALTRMLGYDSTEEFMARMTDVRHQLYVNPEERNAVLTTLLEHGQMLGRELEFCRKDGQSIWVSVNARVVRDDEGRPAFIEGFITDITERRQAEERIRYMAHHDALTGLPNRLTFRGQVDLAIAQARRDGQQVAVLFIDLDRFKHINDSLGHQVGDRLLRTIAKSLQRCLRRGDSIARLGGDEFVISLPRLEHGNDAALVAKKMLEALVQPVIVDGHELHVSGSIGISFYPADGEDAEALMRAADTAMYHAKEKGRNNYQFFTAVLNEAAQNRLTIANWLRRALDGKELVLHYQPQVDLDSGQVTGAEALIRWREPQPGLTSASELIHIAEETGLIVPLGEWVLSEVCQQLKCWRDDGHVELRVAVNLSPYQFHRPGFAALAARLLQEAGVPPAALELEITEGLLMTQSVENVAILEQLALMGIGLAVDDFGTGYSSLSYLQRFPIHALKIDQSFVAGIGRDPNDTAIVSAVIAMAHSLHLRVVAEGVETAEQAAFLKSQRCGTAQGFFYGKPMPPEALSQLLDRHREQLRQPASG